MPVMSTRTVPLTRNSFISSLAKRLHQPKATSLKKPPFGGFFMGQDRGIAFAAAKATPVATVRRTVAKSRLSIPPVQKEEHPLRSVLPFGAG